MIIDGFIFFNEFDILKMRLEELYPVVDRFVIIQADQTFRGEPKQYGLKRSNELLANYSDKVHLEYATMPRHLSNPWHRETWQRNQILEVARQIAGPEDILIISDADEIPRRSTVTNLQKIGGPSRLETPSYYYALNCRTHTDQAIKASRIKDIKGTAEELRRGQPEETAVIENGGWHFSYLGDPAWIRTKLKSFSHSEMDQPHILQGIEEAMANRRDPFGWGQQFTIEQVDDTWPEAVQNDPEYWSKYIWKS